MHLRSNLPQLSTNITDHVWSWVKFDHEHVLSLGIHETADAGMMARHAFFKMGGGHYDITWRERKRMAENVQERSFPGPRIKYNGEEIYLYDAPWSENQRLSECVRRIRPHVKVRLILYRRYVVLMARPRSEFTQVAFALPLNILGCGRMGGR